MDRPTPDNSTTAAINRYCQAVLMQAADELLKELDRVDVGVEVILHSDIIELRMHGKDSWHARQTVSRLALWASPEMAVHVVRTCLIKLDHAPGLMP